LGNTTTGVKAGAIAGIIYGLVLGLLSYVTVISEKSLIIAALEKNLPPSTPFTPDQLYEIALIFTPAVAATLGILGGLVIGAIYGRLFDVIPGRTSVIKGVLVGVILWVILGVLFDLSDLQYGLAVYLGDVAEGLFGAMLFGVLLGYFFGRFTRPPDPAIHGYS